MSTHSIRARQLLAQKLKRNPNLITGLTVEETKTILNAIDDALYDDTALDNRVGALESNPVIQVHEATYSNTDLIGLNSGRGVLFMEVPQDIFILAGYVRRDGTAMTGGGTTYITNSDSGAGPGFYFMSDSLLSSSDWIGPSIIEGKWARMFGYGNGQDGVFDAGLAAGDNLYIWNDIGDHSGGDPTTAITFKLLYTTGV